MEITGSARIEDAPRPALRQIAGRWRARAAIAESVGAGEVTFTMVLSPDGARAMAREVDRLCDFAARLEAQQVALAAIRVRQGRAERFDSVGMAACCAGLLWVQWLALSGAAW